MEQTLIDGLRLTAARDADEEYLAELRRGDREPFAAELFARSVSEGATVVDAGAYLGFHTLLAARRVGSDGIVFAFEPDAEGFDAMRGNVRDNGLEDRVAPLPLSLTESGLDETLGGRPVDLIRLDLGGGAVSALRGMRATLAASANPCAIVACDPPALTRAETSARTLLRELEAVGLEPAAIDEGEWRLLPRHALTPPPRDPVNLYCRRV
jgi:predicted O-methyltransferase YrrM